MLPLQLNPYHLISFLFVARERSFSKASERLAITQPAVTHHIHALEVQFGVKLIHLDKKRVYLTRAGERLLPTAEDFYSQAVMADNFLRNYRLNNLSLGIGTQLIGSLATFIEKFKRLHPSIIISVHEAPTVTLLKELLEFKHDVCLTGAEFPDSEKLSVYKVPLRQPMFFVASPEYPVTSDKRLSWKSLASLPLIVQSQGSGARAFLLRRFKDRGLTPTIGAEVDNIELAKKLVLQKIGIVFMAEANIREEIGRGTLKILEIEDGPLETEGIQIATNSGIASPTIKTFLKEIKGHFKESEEARRDHRQQLPPGSFSMERKVLIRRTSVKKHLWSGEFRTNGHHVARARGRAEWKTVELFIHESIRLMAEQACDDAVYPE